jgi:hypothetical protein
MSSRSLRLAFPVAALALSLASGCQFLKKKADPGSEPAASQAVSAAVPASAAPAEVAEAPGAEPAAAVPDEAIATTEDFEDEAFAKISAETYKTDLEALRKEIEEP